MNLQEIQLRIEELKEKINDHNYRYYVLAEPVITDQEFDFLLKDLEKLESEYPEFITPDSPTQRVGKDLVKVFNPVEHTIPMLSLSNTYTKEELYDFDRRVRDNLSPGEKVEYVVEYKIDGASLSMRYVDGMLYTAATRGDGFVGEEITQNIKTIRSVPIKLKNISGLTYSLKDIEVRGEVFMFIKDFFKLNEERGLRGDKLFANPRNSTAGTLKLQDPRIVAERKLQIFTYGLYSKDEQLNTHMENIEILKKLGFNVNKETHLCSTIEEVLEKCKELEEKRETLPYEIDGAVVKVNSIRQQRMLGNIAKAPRWAVAFKFKAKQAITNVNLIWWSVGRTGTITPVAELQPVFLSGSTISRCTLHNYDEIVRKDIRVNDSVIIEKGGDVIPKIVSVIYDKRNGELPVTLPPTHCPVCSSKLFKPEGEVALYCENIECPAQVKGRLEHFAGRGAMDIEGLGIQIISLFVELNLLKRPQDIYSLKDKKDELLQLERFGKKSVENLVASIEKSKEQPFHKVLYAIGIRYVGSGAAKKLADHFNDMELLMNASEEEIMNIHEIGPSIAGSVKKYFSDPHNVNMIKSLKEHGLQLTSEKKVIVDSPVLGKTFVLTGTLESFSREEATEKIVNLGGKVSSSVSKKTDYVLAGAEAGTKLKKAQDLGVKIINEEDFRKLIES